MKGIPWTKSQDEALAAGWANPRLSRDDVADVLWVTRYAAVRRARRLGLPEKARLGNPPQLLRITAGVAAIWVPGDGGHTVLLDAADAEWFLAFPGGWNVHFEGGFRYVVARSRPQQKLHRLLVSAREGDHVGHTDRDGLNNCRGNLRFVTIVQKIYTSGRRHHSRSEFKGVWLHGPTGLFGGAVTGPTGRRLSIGYYRTEREAARSHDAITRHLRGCFAYQNLPDDPLTEDEIADRPSVARILSRWNTRPLTAAAGGDA